MSGNLILCPSVQCSEILEDSVYVNKEEPPWLVPTKENFGF